MMLLRSLTVLLMAAACCPAATRIKEIATLEGVRDNQLTGYGLVVGLAGTGDSRQTVFTTQSLSSTLQRMGVAVPPTSLRIRNTAAVLITATLPPFAQPGSKIDITAAAIGDASNLQGGLLILTPLRGADGQTYAVAQGPVITGGFVAGRGGNSQTVNHPTVGRLPNGAIVERASPSVLSSTELRLQLNQSDFTTASRVAKAINNKYATEGGAQARAESSNTILVRVPPQFQQQTVEFVSEIESLTIEADRVARIVVNERTGTITIGKDVRIAPTSILHGVLSVEIQTAFTVSQPNPLSQGQTTVVPEIDVRAKEEKAKSIRLQEGASVDDLVRALLAVGSTPRDIIAILQNLQSSGALNAQLEVI